MYRYLPFILQGDSGGWPMVVQDIPGALWVQVGVVIWRIDVTE